MEKIKDIPFFFIVGRPRSGTTLLRTLFDAHPNVIIPLECQFIINLYPKYGTVTHWSKDKLLMFHDDLREQWWFDLWKLDPQNLKSSLLDYEGNHTYSTVCKAVYASYSSFFKKEEIKLFGDKNPGYAIYTERLLKIFPEAKFIHIIRDYRDNFISVRNVDFELPVISIVTMKWRYFIKKFNKARSRYPDSHYILRFEDLITEPEVHFRKLCNFLGLDYTPEVFDFHKKKEDVMKQYPVAFLMKYQSSLLSKIDPGKAGIWKKQLTERQVKIADAVAGRYADESGYERKYKNAGFGIYLQAFPGVLYAGLLNMATTIVDWLPYKWRMNILVKAPFVLTRIYLKTFNPRKWEELSKMLQQKK